MAARPASQGSSAFSGNPPQIFRPHRALTRIGCILLFALLPAVLVAPAHAQGQTPETNRDRPGLVDENTNNTSTPSTGTGRFPSRNTTSQTGNNAGVNTGNNRNTTPNSTPTANQRSGLSTGSNRFGGNQRNSEEQPGQPPGREPGGATTTAGPAQPPGPRSESPAVTTREPSGRGGGANMGTAPGGGTRFTAPAMSSVSVMGQGSFEPVFEHDVEYPEVPDAGAENVLTEEGPINVLAFLSIIHLATNWNIVSTPAANEVELNFYIVETKPRDALVILKKHKIYYEFDEESKFLFVMTEDEHLLEEYADIETEEFTVAHADVTYVESMLSSLMSSLGRIITDQRTNHIYVWDTADNLEQMRKTVADIDVPLEKREYTVMYADLADVEGVVTSLLGPNGRSLADGRTGQLVVWDQPNMLDEVSEAVRRLDVPVEPVTYHISYIEAEDVLDSVEGLLSERGEIIADPRFNTLIVTDLPVRQERIREVIETLDRELETRTWTIQYADIDFIADQIEAQIPSDMGEIVVNDIVHQVTATGLPERLDRIDELIATWDIKRKQVMIEAFLVDMGDSVTRDLNIRWSYFDNSNGSPVVVNSPTGGFPGVNGDVVTVGQLPHAVPLYGDLQLDDSGNIVRPLLTDINGNTLIDRFAGNKIGVSLSYLDQSTDSKLLAAPRVTVQDGEEAIFENAERIPYASSSTTYSSFNYGGNSTSRVEFVDVGIILRVRPRITDMEDILLDIAAEDSSAELVDIESYTSGASDTVASRKAPQVRARNVETQLRIHTGDTVVLGGLRQNTARESTNRVPFLSDIPLLGNLFKSPSRASSNNTLMIFLTPTIVDEFTFPESRMLSEADESMATQDRYNKKPFHERLISRIARGENEIGISIGQTGEIHSEGERVTVDELRDAMFEIQVPGAVTAVIRHHPRTPADVVTRVTEVAMEAGLKVQFDEGAPALVPNYSTMPAEKMGATASDTPEEAAAKSTVSGVTLVGVDPEPAPVVVEATPPPPVAQPKRNPAELNKGI